MTLRQGFTNFRGGQAATVPLELGFCVTSHHVTGVAGGRGGGLGQDEIQARRKALSRVSAPAAYCGLVCGEEESQQGVVRRRRVSSLWRAGRRQALACQTNP